MPEHWIVADQVFDGETLLKGMALCIVDDVVVALAPATEIPQGAQTVVVHGTVTPGFVDLQVNGGGGVLFNHATSATGISQIAAAHHALGTVAIMPTIITDAPRVMEAAAKAALAVKDAPHFAGLHIEGPHIDPAKRGTHDAGFIRPLDDATIQIVRTLRAADIAVMITLAPEAAQLAQITELAAIGATVSLGHSNCTASVAKSAFEAGASCVTHLFNAMSQMQGRAPGLVGAAINSEAYVGTICDGVHVADEMIGLVLRARPAPDRSFIVSDAMPTVGGPDRFTLYDQEIRVQAGRLINTEGRLAGAHTTMAEGVARLVQNVQLPLQSALRMAITVPARVIGAPHLRQITGRIATDMVVLDAILRLRGTVQDAIDNQRA